ncbi:MAG TPA: tRNA (guanosine(46)-N7)-methyltransferase TrmB [Thermotogota bacterium]|nr:tRNA (guanosine(46)-N7)-methyltransferase TrmB [Thermotogota bacterium]HRW92141.1 tRNA (guanosine(46)-N7)-methyltransferase TrmB [Thermotogota bacterium]
MFEELHFVVHASVFPGFPLDWDRIFPKAQPINLEIGFGNGEFIEQLAQHNPHENFVGFEMSVSSVAKTQRRLHRKGIQNVRIVMTDGRFGITNLFPEESLQRVYLNFPCPWSKARHFERRVAIPSFFAALNMVLVKDGVFDLSTDVEGYAMETAQIAREQGFCVPPVRVNEPREIRTRFEKKWMKYGRNIYRLHAQKKTYQQVPRILREVEVMPHARVSKSQSFLDNLAIGVNRPLQSGDGSSVCVFKGLFKDKVSEHFLVKTIAVDEAFEQHFFIDIFSRGDEWVVKLDSVSNPYRTPAVKFAVASLAKLLVRGVALWEGKK